MDRTQRVDEKNVVICLVVMFTPIVMVIMVSKMAHFCNFRGRQQKISHSLGKSLACT